MVWVPQWPMRLLLVVLVELLDQAVRVLDGSPAHLEHGLRRAEAARQEALAR